MIWRFCSLLLGALPVVVLLAKFRPAEDRGGVVGTAAPEIAPPVAAVDGVEVFDRWQDAIERSPGDSVVYLEGLDTAAARALVDNCTDGVSQGLAFDRFAECDREAALAYAEERWPLEERLSRIARVIDLWATEDSQECFEWLDRLEASLPAKFKKGYRWKRFLDDFFIARGYSTPTPWEVERTWRAHESKVGAGTGYSFSQGREGLVDNPETRLPVLTYWTLINAARSTGKWEGILDRMVADGWDYLSPVGRVWLSDDPAGALAWASSIAESAARDRVFGAFFSGFAMGDTQMPLDHQEIFGWVRANAPEQLEFVINEHNAGAASVWLVELPADDPSLDKARQKISSKLIERDLEGAIAWAEAIVDEKQRGWAFLPIMFHWSSYERWAAEAWAKERLGWTDEQCAQRLND